MNRPMQTQDTPAMTNELPVLVRPSRDGDVEAMLAIYRHHIRRGDRGERRRQRHAAAGRSARPAQEPAQSPLAASGRDLRGEVVGYAYVVLFRKRPAYRYTVKHSIYIHHAHLGRGVGRLLLRELIDTCAAAGFRQMIGYIDADNTASLALHEKFGFAKVGLLPGVAYRYGRWADTVMVQRSLGGRCNRAASSFRLSVAEFQLVTLAVPRRHWSLSASKRWAS